MNNNNYKPLKFDEPTDCKHFGSIGLAIEFLVCNHNTIQDVNPQSPLLPGLKSAVSVLRRHNENERILYEAEKEEHEAARYEGKPNEDDLPY